MIAGLGVDIAEIQRTTQAQAKNLKFAAKVLTVYELNEFQQLEGKRAAEYLAGRFSAKESFSKAMGTGLGPVALHSLEVRNDEKGKPYFAKMPFEGRAHLSISHSDTQVVTEVILESEEQS